MASVPRPRSFRPAVLRGGRSSAAPWIPDVDRSTAVIDCAIYAGGVREPGEPSWQDAYSQVLDRDDDSFVWIGLHEPTEHQLAGLAERFDLHPLAVEDAVVAHQRPKLERYDDMLFAVVKTVHYDESAAAGATEVVETGEIMVFLGERFVITVRHGVHGGLRGLRRSLEGNADLLALVPSAVLHGILDHVVDGYLAVTADLQVDIDEIETSVFAGANRAADTNRMYVLKREVLALRRSTFPLVDALKRLTEHDLPAVDEDVHEYFRDVSDHLEQVNEQVASFDDLLNTLVSANLAQVSVVQNEDMRKISAWVAIAAVPTMIAGIWGMNVGVPDAGSAVAFYVLVGVSLLFCAVLYRSFKRNGWL